MGLWFTSPELADHEVIVFQGAANLLRRIRVVGGQLTITGDRLVFAPNRLDKATGGTAVVMPLSTITAISTAHSWSKGLREHGRGALLFRPVEISTADRSAVFVVRKPKLLVTALRAGRQ